MDMDHLFPSTTAGPIPSLPPEPPRQCSGLVSAARGLAGRVLCAVATCVFAAVGSLVGAVTGSMIGLATESGVLRGAGVGAISGAVFAIELAESSHSGDSAGVWSVIHMVDIVGSLLSGRLVREKAGPMVRSAVQSQISAIGSPLFAETSDLFETGGSAKGLPADALSRLPEVEITEDDAADARGCAVCLQDFRAGEPARRLPGCRHVFHVPCIDCWLVRHGSCPLCRRDI